MLDKAIEALRAGRIVAVKGIGGYHLMCDAGNAAAVARLRARKRRPDKPLAVMFPGLHTLRTATRPTPAHEAALCGPARPIVLVPMCADQGLAPGIAPGCAEVGAMLPYSPLHDLLLSGFGGPLVATSGNASGEPVLTEMAEAMQGSWSSLTPSCIMTARSCIPPMTRCTASSPICRGRCGWAAATRPATCAWGSGWRSPCWRWAAT